jgi:hypothetical protein
MRILTIIRKRQVEREQRRKPVVEPMLILASQTRPSVEDLRPATRWAVEGWAGPGERATRRSSDTSR